MGPICPFPSNFTGQSCEGNSSISFLPVRLIITSTGGRVGAKLLDPVNLGDILKAAEEENSLDASKYGDGKKSVDGGIQFPTSHVSRFTGAS
jgi:hypothetical protein